MGNAQGSRLTVPVVGRKWRDGVEPAAETFDDFLARTPQADNTEIGLGADRLFGVGEIERTDIPDDPFAGRKRPTAPSGRGRRRGRAIVRGRGSGEDAR